jgi:hypothetical protein
MTSRIRVISVAVAVALSLGRAHAQVPVTDPAALAELQQEVQNLQQQLQQLQQLYSTAQNTLSSLTGARGMDGIASALNGLRTMVPDDYASNMVLPSALTAFGDIANGAASVIRSGLKITYYPGNDFYQQEVVRHGDRIAGEMAAAQSIYSIAVQRRVALDQLRTQLATTTDQATVAQLQARIAVETSQGINDLNQVQAMLMLQKSNNAEDSQRSLELEQWYSSAMLPALLGHLQ